MTETLWLVMLLIAFILLFAVAILEYMEFPLFYSLFIIILDSIMWFLLSASIFEMEKFYMRYNTSSNAMESGLMIMTSKTSPEVSYFCMMMGVIAMVIGLYLYMSTFKVITEAEELEKFNEQYGFRIE